jgi:hypothetical protein
MHAVACASAVVSILLAGCGNGSSSTDAGGTVTVAGDVPLAYVKRSTALSMNPTDGAPSAPGGDLMVREKSSPSAPEHNITGAITKGVGDASDPEVSYDGKKIVFALRCPTSNNTGGSSACTGRWNIWEYDMTTGGLSHQHRRRRRPGLPACRRRLRVLVQPPGQVAHQPGAGPELQGA